MRETAKRLSGSTRNALDFRLVHSFNGYFFGFTKASRKRLRSFTCRVTLLARRWLAEKLSR